MSKIHTLKIWPRFFADVGEGKKTFEIRKQDRDYAEGDTLVLQEYDPDTDQYTGGEILCLVTYLCEDLPHVPGYCAMGIRKYEICNGKMVLL